MELGNLHLRSSELPARIALLLRATLEAGACHSFAETAFVEEILLQLTDLFIQQEIRLVNQTECDVRNDICRSGLNEGSISLITRR